MCLSVCTLMAFMIDEAHARCMEFHAWFNPYRWARLSLSASRLSPSNLYESCV
jgi:uncharacterized lipoprotein YddW (UPF0748 family)